MIKQTFDVLSASAALLSLWPLFVIVAILIKVDSDGPVFFTLERIGKRFRPFWIADLRLIIMTLAALPRVKAR